MKKKLSKLSLSLLMIFSSFAVFAQPLSADNTEVYSNEDRSVVVETTRKQIDDGVELEFTATTNENVEIDDIQIDGESIKSDTYKYSYAVGKNGDYKFTVKTSQLLLLEEANKEPKEVLRESQFDFTVSVTDIQDINANETTEQDVVLNQQDANVPNEIIVPVSEPKVTPSDWGLPNIDNAPYMQDGHTIKEVSNQPLGRDYIETLPDNYRVFYIQETSQWVVYEDTHYSYSFAQSTRMKRSLGNSVTTGAILSSGTSFYWGADPSFSWFDIAFTEIFTNGELSQCMEPSVLNVSSSNAGTTNLDDLGLVRVMDGRLEFNLTREQKSKVVLIANYGTDAWTKQAMVYEAIGWVFTNYGTGGRPDIETTNERIANHTKVPAWDGTLKQVKIGDTVDLSDPILNDFDLYVWDGLDIVEHSGNRLIVRVREKTTNLVLEKKSALGVGKPFVASDGSSQKVLVARMDDPVYSFIDFDVIASSKLRFHKIGRNNEVLANTTFRASYTNVTDANGYISGDENNHVWDFTTGVDGYTTFEEWNTDGRTVYVQEISAPSGYVVNKQIRAINMTAGEEYTEEFVNDYQRTNITINKIENNWDTIFGENNGKPLSGATFDLFASTDIYEGGKLIAGKDQLIGSSTSDSKGEVTFNDIAIGEYYSKERVAPTGYVLYDGIHNISVKYDGNNPSVEITSTQSTVTNQVIYGKATLIKQDTDRTLLEGAVFGVFTKDGRKITELTSNKSGMIVTPDLRFGDYYFEELIAPDGYYLDSTKIPFTISEHESMQFVTAPNKRIQAKLFGHKVDSETLLPLAGAEFKLFSYKTNDFVTIKYQQGTTVVEKNTWITDANGEFLLEAYLTSGKYKLIETKAPEGYNLGEPIDFVIDENQPYREIEIIGTVLDKDITNRPIRSDVRVTKQDAKTLEYLPNFEFKATNLATQEVITKTTDANGVALFEQLKYGRYMFNEFKVDGEYLLDQTPQFLDIVEDGIVYELKFTNEKPVGQININKTDAKTTKAIANVEYAVIDITDLDPNIEITYEAVKDLVMHETLKTDELGELSFKGLDISRKWAVIELSAPYGYVVDETVQIIDFEYVDMNTPVIIETLNLVNERQTVTVKGVKVDSKTMNMITSKYFDLQLKDKDGNIVPLDHKDENGVHYWVVDALDMYYMTELKAPLGYILSDEVIEIDASQVTEDYIYTIYFKNDAEDIVLPATGMNNTLLNLGLIIVALGLFFVLYTLKNKNIYQTNETSMFTGLASGVANNNHTSSAHPITKTQNVEDSPHEEQLRYEQENNQKLE